MAELVPAICIYVLIPVFGLIVFVTLIRKLRQRRSERMLEFAYFFFFVALGGWLLAALTAEFLFWSGMASLGTFYLLLVAPVVSASIAWKMRRDRHRSGFHLFAFWGHLVIATTVIVTTSFLFGIPVRFR